MRSKEKTFLHTGSYVYIIAIFFGFIFYSRSLSAACDLYPQNEVFFFQSNDQILKDETEKGRGTKTLNLSPFGIIIQSLLNQEKEKIFNYLTSDENNFKIFIPGEINLPEHVDKSTLRNALLLHN